MLIGPLFVLSPDRPQKLASLSAALHLVYCVMQFIRVSAVHFTL